MTEYIPPGIRNVTEIDSPSVNAILDHPTVICLVGPTLGHETISETIALVDNIPQTLSGVNITDGSAYTTINVIDAANKTKTYIRNNDYVISTDPETLVSTIARKLYTTISYSQNVVLILKDSSNAWSLNDMSSYNGAEGNPLIANDEQSFTTSNSIESSGIWLQKAGSYSLGTDYSVSVSGTTSATVTRISGGIIKSGQPVYVYYTTGTNNIAHTEIINLTGTSAISLSPANVALGVNEDSIVVTNTPITVSHTNTAAQYVGDEYFSYSANPVSGVDYLYTISNDDNNNTNRKVTIVRNTLGPTSIGVSDDRGTVIVSYEYVPPNYYSPTLFTNIGDVYAKYGQALSVNGISSPLSFAAMLAFANGANEIFCQPLFAEEIINGKTVRVAGNETSISDWDTTLAALQGIEDINVIVPIVSNGNDNITDGIHLGIFQSVINHINNLKLNGQYAIGIYGEDGSTNRKAGASTLQSHALSLGGSLNPERSVLISPSSFAYANPINQTTINIGGQFLAATVAGMLGARSIQTPLTRKTIGYISKVNTVRTESEKNADANSGLLVIESKNGVIRVRHAITTAVSDTNKRELSAVRSKFFMIESVRKTIDTQIIGQLVADAKAPITVAATVQNVLEILRSSGALVGYANVDAQSVPNQPTVIAVRWTYSLPFPLNYVDITMSLDTVTGSIAVQ